MCIICYVVNKYTVNLVSKREIRKGTCEPHQSKNYTMKYIPIHSHPLEQKVILLSTIAFYARLDNES